MCPAKRVLRFTLTGEADRAHCSIREHVAGRAILQFDDSKPSEVDSRSTPWTRLAELQNYTPGSTNRTPLRVIRLLKRVDCVTLWQPLRI